MDEHPKPEDLETSFGPLKGQVIKKQRHPPQRNTAGKAASEIRSTPPRIATPRGLSGVPWPRTAGRSPAVPPHAAPRPGPHRIEVWQRPRSGNRPGYPIGGSKSCPLRSILFLSLPLSPSLPPSPSLSLFLWSTKDPLILTKVTLLGAPIRFRRWDPSVPSTDARTQENTLLPSTDRSSTSSFVGSLFQNRVSLVDLSNTHPKHDFSGTAIGLPPH